MICAYNLSLLQGLVRHTYFANIDVMLVTGWLNFSKCLVGGTTTTTTTQKLCFSCPYGDKHSDVQENYVSKFTHIIFIHIKLVYGFFVKVGVTASCVSNTPTLSIKFQVKFIFPAFSPFVHLSFKRPPASAKKNA